MRTANLKNHFAAWILFSFMVSTASGDIIYVNPGESIQKGIDLAFYGDTVEVAASTYHERITLKNGVAVIGAGDDVTTIDGDAGGSVVISNGCDPNTLLDGFTITAGHALEGGGMYNYNSSSPTVTNCTFSGNTADYGGGMYNWDNSNPMVTNCTFTGNSASAGSGMLNNSSSPTVTNCTFSGNTAESGGGMYNNYSSPTVTNCTFSGNQAAEKGGGMYNRDGSSSTVTNCTFSGNSAADYGGGMLNDNSNPTVTNCILWGNTAPTGPQTYGGSPIVTYSDVQGGKGQSWFGQGCIDADPCFVDASHPDPNLRSLHMKPDSPCIDAGDTTAVPTGIFVDADGNPRVLDDPQTPDTGLSILGVAVDMGVYEFHPCPIAGDINCDGVVDFKDLAIICANWLAGTEPEL